MLDSASVVNDCGIPLLQLLLLEEDLLQLVLLDLADLQQRGNTRWARDGRNPRNAGNYSRGRLGALKLR
jgi:hypothetical protein